ncbi:plastocyanin/azurin family copper-binding protein [Haloarchaeobius iranensis]|uniref:Tat (Twin-arginine translocation) pathway signal sequence n=1 Tax=Haloarchaeobius iranensis TaxID=996166 RepID=A0A1G9WZF1_9EURY|nr:plastocyanin/azurin family copper-binding protein [Haloarchaeobius iranensis]SDM89523.1 Tat (twin-arginine translocation) pathway signal sequence [Haloarchaeobius iranensis]
MSRDERGSGAGRERSRRNLLRTTGAALAAAVGTAGCLSNPWGPERRGDGGDESGDGTNPATSGRPAAGTDATESRPTTDGTAPTAEPTETATPTTTSVPAEEREPALVVDVAADGFSFAPETFSVAVGDTVHWVWRSSGHNVRVREKPDDSDWTGTPGTASDTYGEGYLHAHTFRASGRYEYYCAPHQTLGLEGSFEVE